MAARAKVNRPTRGDIYLVRLDPATGAEIKKTRPALVIQNDFSNRTSPTTIVVPITSRIRPQLYPTEVLINSAESGLSADSVALFRQLRSVDRSRLLRRIGRLRTATMARVNRAIMITLGLLEL